MFSVNTTVAARGDAVFVSRDPEVREDCFLHRRFRVGRCGKTAVPTFLSRNVGEWDACVCSTPPFRLRFPLSSGDLMSAAETERTVAFQKTVALLIVRTFLSNLRNLRLANSAAKSEFRANGFGLLESQRKQLLLFLRILWKRLCYLEDYRCRCS